MRVCERYISLNFTNKSFLQVRLISWLERLKSALAGVDIFFSPTSSCSYTRYMFDPIEVYNLPIMLSCITFTGLMKNYKCNFLICYHLDLFMIPDWYCNVKFSKLQLCKFKSWSLCAIRFGVCLTIYNWYILLSRCKMQLAS